MVKTEKSKHMKPEIFTVEFIRNLKRASSKQTFTCQKYPGLQLILYPSGRFVWNFRYSEGVVGKKRERTKKLGEWPRFSVHDAERAASKGIVRGFEEPDTEITTIKLLSEYRWSRGQIEKDEQLLASYKKNFTALELDGTLPELANSLTAKHLLDANRRLEKTLKAGTRRNILGFMKRAFAYGKIHGIVENNPLIDFFEYNKACGRNDKPLKPSQFNHSYISLESLGASLRATEGALQDYLMLSILTGMRRCEVQFLQWNEVDLTEGLIWINAPRRKNRRSFPIAISDTVRQILLTRQANQEKGEWWVFPEFAEKSKSHLNYRLKKLGFTPHQLRRTFGKLLEELDIPHSVQTRMFGHTHKESGCAITRQYTDYSRDPLLKEQHDAARKLENFTENVLLAIG
jgi:integrase